MDNTTELVELEPIKLSRPQMRIEGGDVIISLSDDEAFTIIVPSAEIMKISTYFAAGLSPTWSSPKTLETGKVAVWRYGLVYGGRFKTWVLDSKVSGKLQRHYISSGYTKISQSLMK